MERTNKGATLYLGSYQKVIQLLHYADDRLAHCLRGVLLLATQLVNRRLQLCAAVTIHPTDDSLLQGSKDGCCSCRTSHRGVFVETVRSVVGLPLPFSMDSRHRVHIPYNINHSVVRVCKLVESDSNKFGLRLLWTGALGEKVLFLADANLTGAVGLGPGDLEMVKQRGASS